MEPPPPYRSQVLDHRGLVAAMFEELGMGEMMAQATQQNPEMRLVTAGHAVKAMGLNGLGCVNQQLYLGPRFFQNKPTSRLITPGIAAEHLNDEALGRALETRYAYGVTELYRLMAVTAAARLGLAPTFAHLESTSFHGEGRYNSDESPEAHVMPITRGYSRDHRPDLNQVMLELIVEHQAGIPLLMKPLSGHSSDAHEFGEVIQQHMHPLHLTCGTTELVADSALYSADHRQKLAQTQLQWMTRVPATLREAQEALSQAAPPRMRPLMEGYRYHEVASAYGDVAPRWLLLPSEARQPQAQRTVNTQLRTQSDQAVRAFKNLCGTTLACEADARQVLSTFAPGWQATVLEQRPLRPTPRYRQRGRPGQGALPAHLVDSIEGALASR
jgi:transposase